MAAKIRLSYIATALALLSSGSVLAHGYVTQPASRSMLCSPTHSNQAGLPTNSQCGTVMWEPQSVEGADGFPQGGPQDGTIAAAGKSNWSELNAQTSTRWVKTEVEPGPFEFKWHFTAPHKTNNWKYYITKQAWDPNQPLSRDAFDLNPFCVVDGHMEAASQHPNHTCNIPERSGYQVILAVWDVADTAASFYNVLDVDFKKGGQPTSPWSLNNTIYADTYLKKGDTVKTRVFDAKGERPELQTSLTITHPIQGVQKTWSYELAKKINKEQPLIRAGKKLSNDQFAPVYGNNPIYLKNDSGLQRVEIEYDIKPAMVENEMSVSGLADSYEIKSGKVYLDVNVAVTGRYTVTASVKNHNGITPSAMSMILDNESQLFKIRPYNLRAGHHQLVIEAIPADGGQYMQQTLDTMFENAKDPVDPSDYQFTFPEGLKSYTAGTKVFQPRTGKVYQCKPLPEGGWCSIWSAGTTHYEPGTGSHWQDAWVEVK